MSAKDEPINLAKYLAPEEGFQYVRRKELREILAYLVDKNMFAESLRVFYEEIEKEINDRVEKRVQEEMGAFMLSLQTGEEVSEGGIITAVK